MKISFEIDKLKEILVNFYALTGMRFVIFDEEFNKIIAYPLTDCNFCSLLKTDEKAKIKCTQNDRDACNICKKNNKLHIYHCHAGLIEVVAPIKMDDIVIGYMMFGQICEEGKNIAGILNYTKQFNIKTESASEYINEILFKTETEIKAAANLMEICTYYLRMGSLINIDNDNFVIHLSDYINENLTEDLSVEHLCSVFNISRCKLYDISNKHFGMGIAKYIRKKKIEIAKQCFKKKNCSVAEAAETAGFFDYNYFSKIFKKETGITPSEYRKSRFE